MDLENAINASEDHKRMALRIREIKKFDRGIHGILRRIGKDMK